LVLRINNYGENPHLRVAAKRWQQAKKRIGSAYYTEKLPIFAFMTKREKIIHKILELSRQKYPDAEIYLYGSQARGDAKPLSDWDLLILLNSDNIPFALETEIMDEFYNIELETGQIMSPIIYPKKEWNTKYKVTPLFENINKEGIRLI
jgi:uncharacterized protein